MPLLTKAHTPSNLVRMSTVGKRSYLHDDPGPIMTASGWPETRLGPVRRTAHVSIRIHGHYLRRFTGRSAACLHGAAAVLRWSLPATLSPPVIQLRLRDASLCAKRRRERGALVILLCWRKHFFRCTFGLDHAILGLRSHVNG